MPLTLVLSHGDVRMLLIGEEGEGAGRGGGGGCGLPAKTASTSLEGPNVKYWRTPAHSVPELKHDLHFFFLCKTFLTLSAFCVNAKRVFLNLI